MSILDINNSIESNDHIIMNWLKNNIKEDCYKLLSSRNQIRIINEKIYIYGDVILKEGIGNLPEYVNFSYIEGYFICKNCNLTTLRGCPNYVGGIMFDCSDNNLESLKYGPKIHQCCYVAYNNKLTSLKYLPTYIKILNINKNQGLKNTKDLKRKKISVLYACDCNNLRGAEYIKNIKSLMIKNSPLLISEAKALGLNF